MRCLLLPAVLHIVGPRTWRIPAWLDRRAAAPEHRGHGPAARRRAGADGTIARRAAASPPARARRGRGRGSGGLSPPIRRGRRRPRRSAPSRHGAPSAAGRRAAPRGAGAPRAASGRAGVPAKRARAAVRQWRARGSATTRSRPRSRASSGLSVGIMSATQGAYSTDAAAARHHPGRARSPPRPTPSRARPRCRSCRPAPGAVVGGWQAARRRAEDAPQLLRPGLLASRSRAARATRASPGADDVDGVAAADREGGRGRLARAARPRCSRGVAALSQRQARWSSSTCPAALQG